MASVCDAFAIDTHRSFIDLAVCLRSARRKSALFEYVCKPHAAGVDVKHLRHKIRWQRFLAKACGELLKCSLRRDGTMEARHDFLRKLNLDVAGIAAACHAALQCRDFAKGSKA